MMDSSPQYIQFHSEKFETLEELAALKPVEIPLSGYERNCDYIMHTDIDAEDVHATQLNIIYQDENLKAEPFNFKFDRSKVKTLCMPKLDGNDIDTVGYEFEGIISQFDLVKWYRMKWGYPAELPREAEIETKPLTAEDITPELLRSLGIPFEGELIVAGKRD